MKTRTIIALATALFAAATFADHNKTSLPFGLGEKDGHWTEFSDDGDMFEGHYVDGERRGPWTARFANRVVGECVYAKDMDHCDWVMHDADGDVLEDDLEHQLFWRSAVSNHAFETPFVNGKKHGYWVVGNADDFVVAEGLFVNDKRHGHWFERYFFAESGHDVGEGPYVDGKRHGRWFFRRADGNTGEVCYKNDEEVECSSD